MVVAQLAGDVLRVGGGSCISNFSQLNIAAAKMWETFLVCLYVICIGLKYVKLGVENVVYVCYLMVCTL